MKKNNGFTLVELIAVITILALILVIAVPSIFKAKRNADKGIDKEERRNIVEAGKNLGVDLDDNMSEVFNCKEGAWVRDRCDKENDKWKRVTVSVDELVEHGYLTDKTNKWSGLIIVENDKTSGNYKVAFLENESTDESVNKEIIVTFDANGGELTDNTRKFIAGENYGNTPTPIKEGFVFSGWFTQKTGGDEIKRVSPVRCEDHTLYAHWEKPNSTVVFNANGGNVSVNSKGVLNGKEYGVLPTPTRSGYAFRGWFTASSGGVKITETSIVNISGPQTLYARWESKPPTTTYTVTSKGTVDDYETSPTTTSACYYVKNYTGKTFSYNGNSNCSITNSSCINTNSTTFDCSNLTWKVQNGTGTSNGYWFGTQWGARCTVNITCNN